MRTKPFLTFVFASALVFVLRAVTAQEAAEPVRVMERFLGNWQTEVVDKLEPAAGFGGGEQKKIDLEVCGWILDGKILIGKQLSDGGETKGLWLMTYNAESRSYPHWFLGGDGSAGERLIGTWDATQLQMTAKFASDPKIVSTSRFIDRDTVESTLHGTDDEGNVIIDVRGKQTRQTPEQGKKAVAKWAAVENAVELESETAAKTLDRLAGRWEVKRTFRPCKLFPAEVVATSKISRHWIFDKRVLLGTVRSSNGKEEVSLVTFADEDYRSEWFDAAGNSRTTLGLYPESMQFLNIAGDFPENLPPDLTPTASLRFPDDDHYIWTVTIKDASGQKHFEGEWSGVKQPE